MPARYPGAELTLRSGRLRQLLAELDADEIDLAIGRLREDLPNHFATPSLLTEELALLAEELALLTAPGHPLAHRGALPLDAVRDEPFVCLPTASCAASSTGLPPRRVRPARAVHANLARIQGQPHRRGRDDHHPHRAEHCAEEVAAGLHDKKGRIAKSGRGEGPLF